LVEGLGVQGVFLVFYGDRRDHVVVAASLQVTAEHSPLKVGAVDTV